MQRPDIGETALAARLKRQIRAEGPVSLGMYMALALLDPRAGYYPRGETFGADGDFITAPEISQMFGEMIGLTLAERWQAMGAPARAHLIELGPGRGTLMTDLLRAASQAAPGFKAAAQIHFIEASARLAAAQQARVPGAASHRALSEVPAGPSLIVANEFFDALPTHRFVRRADGWREIMVGLDAEMLALAHGAPGRAFALLSAAARKATPVGGTLEASPTAISQAGLIANRLQAAPGAALIIDYGYDMAPYAPTLQAVRGHQMVDIFHTPGDTDLSVHVDFAALTRVFAEAGLTVSPVVEQGTFLMASGIGARAQQLARGGGGATVLAALKRLTAPDAMGRLFKVLGVTSAGVGLPPALLPPEAGL